MVKRGWDSWLEMMEKSEIPLVSKKYKTPGASNGGPDGLSPVIVKNTWNSIYIMAQLTTYHTYVDSSWLLLVFSNMTIFVKTTIYTQNEANYVVCKEDSRNLNLIGHT